jgi:hypothetical protein
MTIISAQLDLPPFDITAGGRVTQPETGDVQFSIGPKRSDKNICLDNGQQVGVTYYTRIAADETYRDYVENLVPELRGHITHIGFQRQDPADCNYGAMTPPHTDNHHRTHNLHWMINPGGQNVTTTWYRLAGQDLIAPKGLFKMSLEGLEPVHTTVWPAGTWGVFRANILHSVGIITEPRISFSVGFNNQALFELLIEKYSLKN